jgi:hypothetical protein
LGSGAPLAYLSMVTGALVRRILVREGAAVSVEYERRGRSLPPGAS